MKKGIWLAAVIVLLGVGLLSLRYFGQKETIAASQPSANAGSEQRSLTELTFHDINGNVLKPDPDKKTLLYFMVSSGCTSCVENEGMLAQFQSSFGIDLISIDINPQNDNKETIQKVMNATKAHWPHVMDEDQSLLTQFQITSLDTVVVLYHNKIFYSGVSPSAATLKKVLL